MPASTTLLIPPATEKNDVHQASASLLSRGVEDLRLAERIEQALHATGYGALRAIDVSVRARIVYLIGQVPSFYLKQIAQATALAIPGTHRIQNDLDVQISK